MRTTPRNPRSPSNPELPLPNEGGSLQGEIRLTTEQLAAVVGVSSSTLARLVRLAVVEPATPGADEFTAETAARLRKMLRLHSDLGVDLYGIAIILDLLERLESLEAELARRGQGGR